MECPLVNKNVLIITITFSFLRTKQTFGFSIPNTNGSLSPNPDFDWPRYLLSEKGVALLQSLFLHITFLALNELKLSRGTRVDRDTVSRNRTKNCALSFSLTEKTHVTKSTTLRCHFNYIYRFIVNHGIFLRKSKIDTLFLRLDTMPKGCNL